MSTSHEKYKVINTVIDHVTGHVIIDPNDKSILCYLLKEDGEYISTLINTFKIKTYFYNYIFVASLLKQYTFKHTYLYVYIFFNVFTYLGIHKCRIYLCSLIPNVHIFY